jgi:hypothetical protein
MDILEPTPYLLIKDYNLELEKDYLFWSEEYDQWIIGYLSSKNTVLLYEYCETLLLADFNYFCMLPEKVK